MTRLPPAKLLTVAAAVAVLLAPLVAAATSGGSNAANKTSAAGSTVEVLSPVTAGQTVLSTTIKTSPTQDLVFSLSMECALWTTVQTVGNDVSEASAKVVAWVEFDGVAVPVSGAGDDGKVVFCDRLHRQTTTLFDDDNATIENYLATREANAFNWLLPDVGQGVHVVEVKADLTTEALDDGAAAQAGVGHRTLVVEPVHLAHGFEL
jgi:hypothetical protein